MGLTVDVEGFGGVGAEVAPQAQTSLKSVETPGMAASADASRCQSMLTLALTTP